MLICTYVGKEVYSIHVSIGSNGTEGITVSSMATNASPGADVREHREMTSVQAEAACISLWSFPGEKNSIWVPKMPLALRPRLAQTVGLGMAGLDPETFG